MVTVTNWTERQRKDGKPFIVLKITGGVRLVEGMNRGRFYATVRKSNIHFTGGAETGIDELSKRIGKCLSIQELIDFYKQYPKYQVASNPEFEQQKRRIIVNQEIKDQFSTFKTIQNESQM